MFSVTRLPENKMLEAHLLSMINNSCLIKALA